MSTSLKRSGVCRFTSRCSNRSPCMSSSSFVRSSGVSMRSSRLSLSSLTSSFSVFMIEAVCTGITNSMSSVMRSMNGWMSPLSAGFLAFLSSSEIMPVNERIDPDCALMRSFCSFAFHFGKVWAASSGLPDASLSACSSSRGNSLFSIHFLITPASLRNSLTSLVVERFRCITSITPSALSTALLRALCSNGSSVPVPGQSTISRPWRMSEGQKMWMESMMHATATSLCSSSIRSRTAMRS
mmetsp:Transcript_48944/g.116521  ORF Transcript_48944/g.116521 Transcript_48944/m.116521 type:complete len:241 (+) Transcript_48944:2185-2907(+)